LAAAFGVIFGAVELPLILDLLVACTMAAIAALLTHAVVSSRLRTKIRALWAAVVILLVAPIVGYIYHIGFDSSSESFSVEPVIYDGIIIGDNGEVFYPSAEPGGAPVSVPGAEPLFPGASYQFDCVATAQDGTEWLRRGETWWVPRKIVRPVAGTQQPEPAQCWEDR
jgi:hypothetical protein